MKKLIIFFLITQVLSIQAQDQDRYGVFLDDALKYADINDREKFEYCLTAFFNAIEEDEISPQTLTKSNCKKLFDALRAGLNEFSFEDNITNLNKLISVAKYWGDMEDTDALSVLGWVYGNYKEDYDSSFYYYDKMNKIYEEKADLGDTDAMCNLGLGYFLEQGRAHDYSLASFYWEKAAELGHVNSMYWLGHLYDYVYQDYATAFRWYNNAALLGNIGAMVSVGELYCEGNGVDQNYTKAMFYYNKAADLGSTQAMEKIGLLYKYGTCGVTKNYITAKYWYEKACYASGGISCTQLEDVLKELNITVDLKKDTDKDGVSDYFDECPEKYGVYVQKGCPDTDDDGIPDHKDK